MKLAKVRHRVMASLLDFGIVLSFCLVILIVKLPFIISMLNSDSFISEFKFVIDIFVWGVLISILMMIYFVVIPLLMNGQTIGKKIFKLKMVKEDGGEIDYKTMFYREGMGRVFINFASLGLTAIVSILIMILREDKKDLADILAKTKVIDLYESEVK